MEVDIGMLQQVETLERKVVSAGLQVKVQGKLTICSSGFSSNHEHNLISHCPPQGWMHPAPQSEREDLVYHEQKLLCSSSPDEAHEDNSQKELASSVVRQLNNPLDIAVIRLAELERNIEQRYLHLSALRTALASTTYCLCFLNKYFLRLLPNKLCLDILADGFFFQSAH